MTDSSLGAERPKSKRRRFQYSLSTLFVLTLAVAAALSGYFVGDRHGYQSGLQRDMQRFPEARVYDVSDLVQIIDPGRYPPAPSPSPVDAPKKPPTPGFGFHDAPRRPVARPSGPVPDFDSLIEVITRTIEPQSWDEVGGPGSIAPHEGSLTLVISQTPFEHEEIESLFQKLREKKAARTSGDQGVEP